MKIHKNTLENFGYVYIEDVYTEDELTDITKEIESLTWMMDNVPDIQKIRDAESALYDDGKPKMTGNGVKVDYIYQDRACSPILKHNRKLVVGKVADEMASTHPANVAVYQTKFDFTCLNKYKNGHEYAPHHDTASFTAITFLSLDDEEMVGGDFVFSDYDITLKFKNNTAVFFPSWVMHHCTKLESQNSVRYSIAQFSCISYE